MATLADTPSRTDSYSGDEKLDVKGSDEKNFGINSFHSDAVAYDTGVDVAVKLVAGDEIYGEEITPEESNRIRKILDWHLLPLLFLLYTLQYLDKSAVGASAILGLITDNHLTTDEYNDLSSVFYIGLLIFEYPHNWALQRLSVAKWLTGNVFLWALLIGLHATCSSYAGLCTLRFLLGASEGAVTTSLMITTSMFYTRREIGERISWVFMCNGLAQIVSGFLAFGVYHVNPKANPNQWQWLMIIIAILTFFTGVLFYFRYPDNPTTAWFLTPEDRIKAIKRIRGNQNGIETKVWKKSQFIEALTDYKTWLFFFMGAICALASGILVQYSLIISGFGFTTLQTTLLNIPSGAAQIMGTICLTTGLHIFPNARSILGSIAFIPSVLAAILLITLPWSNRVGLLSSYYVTQFTTAAGFCMMMSWVVSVTAGHTKKLTTNALFLIAYSIGMICSSQFWKARYRPRNYIPWSINLTTYALNIVFLLTIRFLLNRENKRRDRLQAEGVDEDEYGYVERVDEKGEKYQQKVEKALLDLTDRQNLAFRYCL